MSSACNDPFSGLPSPAEYIVTQEPSVNEVDDKEPEYIIFERKESEEGDFVCGECGRTFHHRSQLRGHMSAHSIGSYSCLKCDKRFKHKSTLDVHMGLHKDIKARGSLDKFKCKKCNKQFTFLSTYRAHARKYVCCRSYDCLDCHISFSHTKTLFRHMCIEHQGEALQIREFECAKCLKWITLRLTAKNHLDEKRLLCCSCLLPQKKTMYSLADSRSGMQSGNQIQNVRSVPLNSPVNVTDGTKTNVASGVVMSTRVPEVKLAPGDNAAMSNEANSLLLEESTAVMAAGTNSSEAFAGKDILVPAVRVAVALPSAMDSVVSKGTGFPNLTQSDLTMVPSKGIEVVSKEEKILSENLKLQIRAKYVTEEMTVMKEEVDEEFNVEQIFIKEL